jgi:acetyl-CoA synthetase
VVGGERCPIVDTWWQTETGAIMITPLPGIILTKPGSATRAFPGVAADVVDEREGKPLAEGQGLLVLQRPWPSMLRGLYKEDDRFVETCFSKFGNETYLVGDAARKDKDGYFWIIGRIDDVVNVSGHRLSTAEVESAIVSHHKVAEAAVIGQSDEDSGQAICAFVTLQGTIDGTDELGRRDPPPRGRPDRQVRPSQADHLGRRPAQAALREDHAPAAPRHRRRSRDGRRDDAARP